MVGDRGREKVIAKTAKKSLQTCAYISLKEISHKKGELPLNEPNFRFTNFSYYLKYKVSANKGFKYKPYMIVADIFMRTKGVYRFANYEEFLKLGETDPEIGWLVRNTIHSRKLFEIAKHNYHIPIMLAFDAAKYAKKVIANDAEKNGGDSDMGIFLVKDVAEAEKYRHELYLEQFKKKDVKL